MVQKKYVLEMKKHELADKTTIIMVLSWATVKTIAPSRRQATVHQVVHSTSGVIILTVVREGMKYLYTSMYTV